MHRTPPWGDGPLGDDEHRTVRAVLHLAIEASAQEDDEAELAAWTQEVDGYPMWSWAAELCRTRWAVARARVDGFPHLSQAVEQFVFDDMVSCYGAPEVLMSRDGFVRQYRFPSGDWTAFQRAPAYRAAGDMSVRPPCWRQVDELQVEVEKATGAAGVIDREPIVIHGEDALSEDDRRLARKFGPGPVGLNVARLLDGMPDAKAPVDLGPGLVAVAEPEGSMPVDQALLTDGTEAGSVLVTGLPTEDPGPSRCADLARHLCIPEDQLLRLEERKPGSLDTLQSLMARGGRELCEARSWHKLGPKGLCQDCGRDLETQAGKHDLGAMLATTDLPLPLWERDLDQEPGEPSVLKVSCRLCKYSWTQLGSEEIMDCHNCGAKHGNGDVVAALPSQAESYAAEAEIDDPRIRVTCSNPDCNRASIVRSSAWPLPGGRRCTACGSGRLRAIPCCSSDSSTTADDLWPRSNTAEKWPCVNDGCGHDSVLHAGPDELMTGWRPDGSPVLPNHACVVPGCGCQEFVLPLPTSGSRCRECGARVPWSCDGPGVINMCDACGKRGTLEVFDENADSDRDVKPDNVSEPTGVPLDPGAKDDIRANPDWDPRTDTPDHDEHPVVAVESSVPLGPPLCESCGEPADFQFASLSKRSEVMLACRACAKKRKVSGGRRKLLKLET